MTDTVWTKPCAYDATQKSIFHRRAKRSLKALAHALGLANGQYDLRSNLAGIAVSGEITLHTDDLYVQASQCSMGPTLLYRTCKGRRDIVGGPNHFAPLAMLDDLPPLVAKLLQLTGGVAR